MSQIRHKPLTLAFKALRELALPSISHQSPRPGLRQPDGLTGGRKMPRPLLRFSSLSSGAPWNISKSPNQCKGHLLGDDWNPPSPGPSLEPQHVLAVPLFQSWLCQYWALWHPKEENRGLKDYGDGEVKRGWSSQWGNSPTTISIQSSLSLTCSR